MNQGRRRRICPTKDIPGEHIPPKGTLGKDALDTDTDRQRLETALELADMARDIACEGFRTVHRATWKDDGSPVTEIDRRIEKTARNVLAARFPGDVIYGEEFGGPGGAPAPDSRQPDGPYRWIIDPVDGTRAFLSGHPLFGFLLGGLRDGRAQFGLVAMPALDEIFLGVRGRGATLDGRPVTTSPCTDLRQAVLYINEGQRICATHPEIFARLAGMAGTVRLSHDCYSHALVAAGYADACIDFDLKPHDFLPLLGLVEAAGGVMSDWQGTPLTQNPSGRIITAANPQLHLRLMRLIAGEPVT